MKPRSLKIQNKGLFAGTRFSKINLSIFALIFAGIGGYLILSSFAASSPDIYLAQNQAGSADGSSCANAKAVSFFNVSGNWGTNTGQIGPGTTVHLCGTITTTLTAQGSGVSGSPITVLWESGATVSEPFCSPTGCFNTNNKQYLTLDGGSNGIVQATANGSGLANQQAGNGISASSCNNCIIQNLTVANIYNHTSLSDTNGNAQSTGGINFSGSSNITIQNNTIYQVGAGLYDTPSNGNTNIRIANNNIYNVNWAFGLVGQTSAGSYGNFYMYGNHIHDWSAWDTNSDAFHHNGIYCFTGSGVSTLPSYTGIYIYNNVWDGVVTTSPGGVNNATAIVWPGANTGGLQTNPGCANLSTPWYVFNNVFNPTVLPGDGAFYPTCCAVHAYNNTFITPTSSSGSSDMRAEYGGTTDLRNNLFYRAKAFISVSSPSTLSPAEDYNFYVQGGTEAWNFNGFLGFPSGFPTWQSRTGGDSHSQAYTGTFTLNSDGSLPSGSPAIGQAENLTSTCSGQPNPGLGALCSDIAGVARPSTGAWDAGAYQSGSGGTPAPTVSLSASPTSITSGDSSTLSWSVTNAAQSNPTSCSAVSPAGWTASTATSGTQSVSPSSTTTYTISCTGPGGTGQGSATVTVSAVIPPGCSQSTTTWQNTSFSAQTANFTFDFDATPNANNIDGVTGVSNGAATGYTSLAAIARFNDTGTIDAIDGSSGTNTYHADTSVPYTSGTSYHFKLTINPTAHTYSVVVTPSGGTATTIATNYGFRTDQATTSSFNNWALFEDPASSGSHNVCNAAVAAVTKTGDINGDGSVNIFDLSLLLSSYGASQSACVTNASYTCDLNSDNTINVFDLSMLLSHYGT